MSKPINRSQLSRITGELWRAIKAKIGHFFNGANYDEATKTITLTKEDGSTIDVELSNLISIDEGGIVKSVNGEDPDATGAVTLTLEVDQTPTDSIELSLGGQVATIEFATDDEIQEIIDQFI